MMIKTKISVLMTVFNAENFLKSSVKSIINQSFLQWELIIIDDCSKDNSVSIIKSFKNKKIKVYKLNKHLGRTKALNYGINKCKGKYIAISALRRIFLWEVVLVEEVQMLLEH